MDSNDGQWVPIFEVGGIVVPYDGASKRIFRTADGRVVEPSPVFCLNGHRHGPGRTLVGHQACQIVGGHLTYYCRVCRHVTYVPAETGECDHRAFDGRRPLASGP